MLGWQRHEKRLSDQHLAAQCRIVDWWPDKSHVEPTVSQESKLGRNRERLCFDLDVPVHGIEPADEQGEIGLVHAETEADTQPLHSAGSNAPGQNGRAIRTREDVARFIQEQPPGVRQFDAPFVSMHQARLQLSLELANLMAQGGLRNVQLRRRLSKVQAFCNRHEIAQVS